MAAADLDLRKTTKAKSKGKRNCIEAAVSATRLRKKSRRGGED
jgi:hypothetical protein